MKRISLAALLLAPTLAAAAKYDPGSDRAALRSAATSCHTSMVDATGLPLEMDKVPAITKGVDESLRLAKVAADTAAALDAAAIKRCAEMAAGAATLDRRIKDAEGPVAAARKRANAFAAELAEDKKKIKELPEPEREKYPPRVAKADAALASAEEALRPAEDAVAALGQRALEMKDALRRSRAPLAEISAASTATVVNADNLPAPAAEFKNRLADLGKEPREQSRARAQQKIAPARDASLLIFQAADRACNRADDLRRASSAYDDAASAFEKALPVATPTPASPFLDAAQKALTQLSELLKTSK